MFDKISISEHKLYQYKLDCIYIYVCIFIHINLFIKYTMECNTNIDCTFETAIITIYIIYVDFTNLVNVIYTKKSALY